jgi:hypothetical protein
MGKFLSRKFRHKRLSATVRRRTKATTQTLVGPGSL